jgi:hypothetical protein
MLVDVPSSVARPRTCRLTAWHTCSLPTQIAVAPRLYARQHEHLQLSNSSNWQAEELSTAQA